MSDLEREVRAALAPVAYVGRTPHCVGRDLMAALVPVVVRLIEEHGAPLIEQ